MNKTSLRLLISLLLSAICAAASAATRNASYQAAVDSIVAADLGKTDETLASPSFEGREAGTRGGHAAGDYLVGQLRKLPLKPAGDEHGYFQGFGSGYRNIAALLPGSDTKAKEEVIVVGAHYDHLGLARPGSNYPLGTYFPGADDNASGSSAVLAMARAFCGMPAAPRRSILFMLFDGEEKGLLGSKHWTAEPTLPLERVKFMLNLDMIGALRAERLIVFGTRTATGLRRFAAECNQDHNLTLDFSWLMKGDADHFSFYSHGIPAVFLHTDLHERYHKPTDVAEKVNRDGMQRVTRLAFAMLYEMADGPLDPKFRKESRGENEDGHRRLEAVEPLVQRPTDKPMRLGLAWRTDDAEPGTVIICSVAAGSPAAAAGIKVGDRIYRIGGRDFADDTVFTQLARTLPGPLELLVERDGRLRSVVLRFAEDAVKIKKV